MMDDIFASPTGRFEITVSPWEARMSLWIDTPTVQDTRTGEPLLSFTDSNWSLNSAIWHSDAVVELRLRKYPGSHSPPEVCVTLDCDARTARIADEVVPIERTESLLDHALTWPQAAPEPLPRGLAGVLTRLYRIWRGQA